MPAGRSWSWVWWFVVPMIVVIGLWTCTWLYLGPKCDRGTFGDMFGSVNALFSGLAFAAFLFALNLQRIELRGAEAGQKESREALDRQQKALSLQIEELERARAARALIFLFELLQRPDFMEARRHVIQVLANKDYQRWMKSDKTLAAKVCSSYDIAGILVRENLIEARVLEDDYGASIRRCFPICMSLIDEYRYESGDKRYWNDFELLYHAAEKYKESTQT